jgi:protoporphyrinogen/coproporphyrinogen III oxidase
VAHIVIIGGGIAGLAAAYRCEQLAGDVAVTVVEREKWLGGKILTERSNGFVIEGAPDSFLSRKLRGLGLCRELGLAEQLHGRDPRHEKTFVRRGQELHRLPTGLTGMIPTNLEALQQSSLISPAGRARLAEEPALPPAPPNGDESVAHFVSRRLGREVYEALVEPLMSGIYAGDGDQLSLAATFPQLRQLELKHGSLLKGLQAAPAAEANGQQPAARPVPPFVSLPGGMATLVETLLAQLRRTELITGMAVAEIRGSNAPYSVLLADGRTLAADALILATPAFVTAQLLATVAPDLAELHSQIPYASAAIITLAFAQADLPRPLDGYGYVIPQTEGTDLLACTWTSSKWAGRAPAGMALIRVYAGRYGRRDVTRLSDAELIELAQTELSQTLGLTATPQLTRIHRWPQAMPQYLLGHVERVAQIEQRLAAHPAIFLAGAAYRGVGIPDCIESGEAAARGAVRLVANGTTVG